MAGTVVLAISRCFTALFSSSLSSSSGKGAVALRCCSLVLLSAFLVIPVASYAAPASAVPAGLSGHARVLVVDKSNARAQLFQQGTLAKSYEIGLSQVAGRKQKEGDLKMPEGQYRVVEKLKGPFDATKDWSKAYLGTRWLRLDYPNAVDAARGLEAGLIKQAEFDAIAAAARQGKATPANSALGGGIGIHGWVSAGWKDDESRALTWGCVSMHAADLEEVFDILQLGDVVLIQP